MILFEHLDKLDIVSATKLALQLEEAGINCLRKSLVGFVVNIALARLLCQQHRLSLSSSASILKKGNKNESRKLLQSMLEIANRLRHDWDWTSCEKYIKMAEKNLFKEFEFIDNSLGSEVEFFNIFEDDAGPEPDWSSSLDFL